MRPNGADNDPAQQGASSAQNALNKAKNTAGKLLKKSKLGKAAKKALLKLLLPILPYILIFLAVILLAIFAWLTIFGTRGSYQNYSYGKDAYNSVDGTGGVTMSAENQAISNFYQGYSNESYYQIVGDDNTQLVQAGHAGSVQDYYNRENTFLLSRNLLFALDDVIYGEELHYPEQFIKPLNYDANTLTLAPLLKNNRITVKSKKRDSNGIVMSNGQTEDTTADYGLAPIFKYKTDQKVDTIIGTYYASDVVAPDGCSVVKAQPYAQNVQKNVTLEGYPINIEMMTKAITFTGTYSWDFGTHTVTVKDKLDQGIGNENQPMTEVFDKKADIDKKYDTYGWIEQKQTNQPVSYTIDYCPDNYTDSELQDMYNKTIGSNNATNPFDWIFGGFGSTETFSQFKKEMLADIQSTCQSKGYTKGGKIPLADNDYVNTKDETSQEYENVYVHTNSVNQTINNEPVSHRTVTLSVYNHRTAYYSDSDLQNMQTNFRGDYENTSAITTGAGNSATKYAAMSLSDIRKKADGEINTIRAQAQNAGYNQNSVSTANLNLSSSYTKITVHYGDVYTRDVSTSYVKTGERKEYDHTENLYKYRTGYVNEAVPYPTTQHFSSGVDDYMSQYLDTFISYVPQNAIQDFDKATIVSNTTSTHIAAGANGTDQELLSIIARYGDTVKKYCAEYNVDPNLFFAIMRQENSSGNPNDSDGGLTQINKIEVGTTVSARNVQTGQSDSLSLSNWNQVFDPDFNIHYGVIDFRQKVDKFNGDELKALQARNFNISGYMQQNHPQEWNSANDSWINYSWIEQARISAATSEGHSGSRSASYDCDTADAKTSGYTYGDTCYLSHVLRYVAGSSITTGVNSGGGETIQTPNYSDEKVYKKVTFDNYSPDSEDVILTLASSMQNKTMYNDASTMTQSFWSEGFWNSFSSVNMTQQEFNSEVLNAQDFGYPLAVTGEPVLVNFGDDTSGNGTYSEGAVISASPGTDVTSIFDGIVESVGTNSVYGTYVKIDNVYGNKLGADAWHKTNQTVVYAHLGSIPSYITAGAHVTKGEVLGKVVTFNHINALYFEFDVNNIPINPQYIIGSASSTSGYIPNGNNQSPSLSSDAYTTLNPFAQSGYTGQCTWYVWGRVYELYKIKLPFLHDARTWSTEAATTAGYTVSDTPKSGCIAVWDGGKAGHVAFVENVSGDNVTITEANYSQRDQYNGYKILTKEGMAARDGHVKYVYFN